MNGFALNIGKINKENSLVYEISLIMMEIYIIFNYFVKCNSVFYNFIVLHY